MDISQKKICSICKQYKNLDEFYFRNDTKSYRTECKECHLLIAKRYKDDNKERIAELKRNWYKKNRTRYLEKGKEYRVANTEKIKIARKDWYEKNKDKVRNNSKKYRLNNRSKTLKAKRLYYENNKQAMLIKNKQWKEENKEYTKKYMREYFLNNREKVYAGRDQDKIRLNDIKRRNIPKNKINASIKAGMYYSLKKLKSKSGRHWEDLVEYNLEYLMKHLESQFNKNMDWNNYGSYWQIDHITPISVFNFSKPVHMDFRRCWALENLRPLESHKNQSKGNKIMTVFQPCLEL